VTREQVQEFKKQAQQAGAGAPPQPNRQNIGIEKSAGAMPSAKSGQRRSALKTEHSGSVRAAERRGRPERLFGDGSPSVYWRPNYVGRSVRELNITGEDENDT
jgi:hypothetical protein